MPGVGVRDISRLSRAVAGLPLSTSHTASTFLIFFFRLAVCTNVYQLGYVNIWKYSWKSEMWGMCGYKDSLRSVDL